MKQQWFKNAHFVAVLGVLLAVTTAVGEVIVIVYGGVPDGMPESVTTAGFSLATMLVGHAGGLYKARVGDKDDA